MTWFLLMVSIDGGVFAALPFADAKRCGDAIPALHDALAVDHADLMIQCIDTGVAKVRPRARPEGI